MDSGWSFERSIHDKGIPFLGGLLNDYDSLTIWDAPQSEASTWKTMAISKLWVSLMAIELHVSRDFTKLVADTCDERINQQSIRFLIYICTTIYYGYRLMMKITYKIGFGYPIFELKGCLKRTSLLIEFWEPKVLKTRLVHHISWPALTLRVLPKNGKPTKCLG